jgi:indole-3-glycerol phosphate synthase
MKVMPVTLDHLVADARRRAVEARSAANLPALMRKSEAHVPRGFKDRLQQVAKTRPAVIAELKKASPSKGLIREPFHVSGLATQLANAGAASLSVLTEEQYFLGSLTNLVEASAATELPCLRKDFIVDQFQILEARAHHADAILLIVAGLSHPELDFLFTRAKESGLDVLVEVHDEEELDAALEIGADIIGVNSRNLKTFEVSLETAFKLADRIPENVVRVAESGIHDAHDISMLRSAGFHAFLIGESLMRAANPGDKLRRLLQTDASIQGAVQ